MSEIKNKKSTVFVSFFLFLLTCLFALTILIGTALCNNSKIYDAFTSDVYVDGLYDEMFEYAADRCLQNDLSKTVARKSVRLDEIEEINGAYWQESLFGENGEDEGYESVISVCVSKFRDEVAKAEPKATKAQLNAITADFEEYLRSCIEFPLMNYIQKYVPEISSLCAYVALGSAFVLLVLILILRKLAGKMWAAYCADALWATAFVTLLFSIIATGIMLLKELKLYPAYLSEIIVRYAYEFIVSAAFAGLVIAVLAITATAINAHMLKEERKVDDVLDEDMAVTVRNLTMAFTLSKEKVDNLKEYVIKILKRQIHYKQFYALDDVNFDVKKGDHLAILGLNGAGKSTLLKAIVGVYKPSEGTVKTQGVIAPLLELGAGFDPDYSGKENIFLYGAILGYDREYLQSKYDEIVEFSELGKFIDVPIKNYSSGMKARLGFSIATAVEPDILILDEVLSVGDAGFRKKSLTKVQSLFDNGVTVLFVSHNIQQVKEICDKAILLEKGKIIAQGDVDTVSNVYEKKTSKKK